MRIVRRYVLLLSGVLVVALLLYKSRNSITLEGFRWSMVGESLRTARIQFLLLSVAAIYVCYAVRALRWMRFSRALGETHFWNVYGATLMGFSCLFVLGRAGEPVRPVLIAKKDSLSVPRMFGVYFLERVFDVAAAVVIAGLSLLLFKHKSTEDGGVTLKMARAGEALLAVLAVVVVLLIYLRYHGADWLGRRLRKPKWRVGWRGKIVLLLEGFAEGLQEIRTWKDLGVLVGYTAAHWFLVTLVYLWVVHAFGGRLGELNLRDAMLVLAFTLVGSIVQLPGVGGGAQGATFLVLTRILGVVSEPAAVASVVLWLITFASCVVVGLPLLFHEGWSMGELRRMARAEEEAGEAALLDEAEHAADSRRRPQ